MVGVTTEAYAEMFAFMSLVDPDPTARAAHGQRARNLLMYVMNDAVKGLDTSANPAPFQGEGFSTYNRANYWGEAFGLTVDWAYPYFSAADKATIQKVFLRWSKECLKASTTAEEHPPAGKDAERSFAPRRPGRSSAGRPTTITPVTCGISP